jgi:hypothetical protein
MVLGSSSLASTDNGQQQSSLDETNRSLHLKLAISDTMN